MKKKREKNECSLLFKKNKKAVFELCKLYEVFEYYSIRDIKYVPNDC